MSAASKHKQTYLNDKEFLEYGISSRGSYNNWTIVVSFYCAVHAIEFLLDKWLDKHSKGHSLAPNGRKTYMQGLRNVQRFDELVNSYDQLLADSYAARYECITFSKNDVIIARKLLDNVVYVTGIEK